MVAYRNIFTKTDKTQPPSTTRRKKSENKKTNIELDLEDLLSLKEPNKNSLVYN